MARNGVIGLDGELPWAIPQDMSRFKALTDGHPIVMGRVTHESIGRPLSGRTNIVLTRNKNFRPGGVEPAATVEEAMLIAKDHHGIDTDLYVIGGSAVYEQFLSLADRLELTIVDCEPRGDAWFPSWNPAGWRQVAAEAHEGVPPFEFKTFERVRPA